MLKDFFCHKTKLRKGQASLCHHLNTAFL
jgi:hypothetical protein